MLPLSRAIWWRPHGPDGRPVITAGRRPSSGIAKHATGTPCRGQSPPPSARAVVLFDALTGPGYRIIVPLLSVPDLRHFHTITQAVGRARIPPVLRKPRPVVPPPSLTLHWPRY